MQKLNQQNNNSMKTIGQIAFKYILVVALGIVSIALQRENKSLKTQISQHIETAKLQAENIKKLSEMQTFKISLQPKIDTKITSAFGKTSQVYFNYYFQMDGNTMEMIPQQSYSLQKETIK